jgi:hypothetical protein
LGARRQQWMPFRPPFLSAGERFVKSKMSFRIFFFSVILSIYKTPPKSLWPNPADGRPRIGLGAIH